MQTLRSIRRTRDLTFVDLALLSGIPARAIAEAEYGLRHLSNHEVEAIALVLGLSPTTLFPPFQQRSSSPNLTPLLLTAGLATSLALSPLVMTEWQRAQQQLLSTTIHHVGVALNASGRQPTPDIIRPSPTAPQAVRSIPATPTADALAPLIAPLPPRTPTPIPTPSFYLDEAGPHGCPVQPTTGQVVITQGYGMGTHAPAHVWGAVDLAVDGNGDGIAEPGSSWYTPIVATHHGVVRVTLDSYPAGHHVWVMAPDGIWRTGYAHLAVVTVIDGQYVQAGDVIGLMGNTGFASGPHLDYQVWRGEENIDPTTLVGCGTIKP